MDQIVVTSSPYDAYHSHPHPCRKYRISVSSSAQRRDSQLVLGAVPLALFPLGEQAEGCVCVPSGSLQNAGWGQAVISTAGLVD